MNWEKLARAEAHPLKIRILERLQDEMDPISPAMLAREFGEEVGSVGYHTRKLAAAGFVELVDERPVRGAIEHFYRAVTV